MLFFTHCKEEPVQPKETKSTAGISAAKLATDAQLARLLDDDKTAKKEKFEKLKAEHEKPYVMLKKPIDALREFLAARKTGKPNGSSKNVNQKSVMQQVCNPIYVDNWAFEKYTPSSGVIGILPPSTWQRDTTNLNILKNKYGFRQVLMEETAIRDNQSDFTNSEMYLCLTEVSYGLSIINTYSDGWCAGLYFEEPYSHSSNAHIMSESQSNVSTISQAWKNKYTTLSSQIILGETTQEIIDQLDGYVDNVTSTIYAQYSYPLPPSVNYYWHTWTVPFNSDQRPVWWNCNSSFGSKFDYLFINASEDASEMGQLIAAARGMGKNNIWLYNPGGYVNYIDEFCYHAYGYGMLSRWTRKYLYEYTYIGTGDPCTDNDETHWWLTDIITTQIVEQD